MVGLLPLVPSCAWPVGGDTSRRREHNRWGTFASNAVCVCLMAIQLKGTYHSHAPDWQHQPEHRTTLVAGLGLAVRWNMFAPPPRCFSTLTPVSVGPFFYLTCDVQVLRFVRRTRTHRRIPHGGRTTRFIWGGGSSFPHPRILSATHFPMAYAVRRAILTTKGRSRPDAVHCRCDRGILLSQTSQCAVRVGSGGSTAPNPSLQTHRHYREALRAHIY